MRERVRYLHYILQTEKAYVYWANAFMLAGRTMALFQTPMDRKTALREMLAGPLWVETGQPKGSTEFRSPLLSGQSTHLIDC